MAPRLALVAEHGALRGTRNCGRPLRAASDALPAGADLRVVQRKLA